MSFDIILAGLGAVGSATAVHLAGRGVRVLGLDRYRPPHDRGSTHGQSRVIRETAFEGPAYVPLVRRAFDNWRQLEAATGQSLLHITGVLFVGPPLEPVVQGTLGSARAWNIPHELLDEPTLARRYPAFREIEGSVAVLEPGAGWLDPERCVSAALHDAAARGIELRFDEPVLSWQPDGAGVTVVTPAGRYTAGALLLAAGPWTPRLLGARGATFSVERQVMHWFEPGDRSTVGRLPVFIRQAGGSVFYGLPPVGIDVKVAVHHDGEPTTPDAVRREVAQTEIDSVQALLRRYLPALAGPHRRAAVCLYTNSPDGNFVIDRLPDHPAVVLASACSGFGFKFASAVGECVADLLTDRTPACDLSPFRIGR